MATSPTLGLDGKIILITGGLGGLVLAIVHRLSHAGTKRLSTHPVSRP